MKRTVFVLSISVLLTITVCLSAPAQGTWSLHREFPEPSDISEFWCVEFVDNNTVIIGASRLDSGGRLYKWNFNTNSKSSVNILSPVFGLAIAHTT